MPRTSARCAAVDILAWTTSEGWSGLRESNPSSWLGKPEHYHYATPARADQANRSGLRLQNQAGLPPPPTSGSDIPQHLIATLLHDRVRHAFQVQTDEWLGVRGAHVEM